MSYSGSFANTIYAHSGESQKVDCIAQQASINEDLEKRRRQLDSLGEAIKMASGKQVASLIDETPFPVGLKHVTYKPHSEALLQKAQDAAALALHSTIDTANSAINTATASTAAAINSATASTAAVISSATASTAAAADIVTAATKEAASTVSHIGHDAAGLVSSVAKSTFFSFTHAAQEVGHRAAAIAGLVKDTTTNTAASIADKATHTAEAVSHKTKELADKASAKAIQVAENISHFTTLVSVLADEENERSRRLVSGDEAIMAANAFRVSGLIRDLGIAFYKQETPNLNYCTKILEENERRWRLNSSTTARAESNAHLLGKMVKSNLQSFESFAPRNEWVRVNVSGLEEAERLRRLKDSNEVLAILNAFTISSLISNSFSYNQEFSRAYLGYATTLLEENERRSRIIEWRIAHPIRDASHILQDLVADNIEKFNYSTRHAAQFANEFAHLLGNATKQFASNFSHQAKDIAEKTASRLHETADHLVQYGQSVYIIALEEKERTRRINDPAEITAIQNAWFQSQLIRDLSALYRASSFARFPVALIEEQERRWRLTHITPSASRKLAAIVVAEHAKFEQSGLSWAAKLSSIEHARDVAVHSRLNPNAPAFVPHQAAFTKVEPAIVQQNTLRAAGAQF